jgi:hypothetical protein
LGGLCVAVRIGLGSCCFHGRRGWSRSSRCTSRRGSSTLLALLRLLAIRSTIRAVLRPWNRRAGNVSPSARLESLVGGAIGSCCTSRRLRGGTSLILSLEDIGRQGTPGAGWTIGASGFRCQWGVCGSV